MTKAFEFLDVPPRSVKPRSDGLTMVIDSGLGLGHLEDLLAICAEYVDIWKLGWATTQLQDEAVVEAKTGLLKTNGIQVMTGGTLFELAERHQVTEAFLDALLRYGFDAVEVSSGSLEIDEDRICEVIQEANGRGLTCFCEVGKKDPSQDMEAAHYNQQILRFLEAGAEKVIVEARESGVKVGLMDHNGQPSEEKLAIMTRGVPSERVVFEAPLKNQQIFFLRRFGPETSLGNINPTDIISLETLRRGLRGDTVHDFHTVISERHIANQKL